jgi:hypothetical protein
MSSVLSLRIKDQTRTSEYKYSSDAPQLVLPAAKPRQAKVYTLTIVPGSVGWSSYEVVTNGQITKGVIPTPLQVPYVITFQQGLPLMVIFIATDSAAPVGTIYFTKPLGTMTCTQLSTAVITMGSYVNNQGIVGGTTEGSYVIPPNVTDLGALIYNQTKTVFYTLTIVPGSVGWSSYEVVTNGQITKGVIPTPLQVPYVITFPQGLPLMVIFLATDSATPVGTIYFTKPLGTMTCTQLSTAVITMGSYVNNQGIVGGTTEGAYVIPPNVTDLGALIYNKTVPSAPSVLSMTFVPGSANWNTYEVRYNTPGMLPVSGTINSFTGPTTVTLGPVPSMILFYRPCPDSPDNTQYVGAFVFQALQANMYLVKPSLEANISYMLIGNLDATGTQMVNATSEPFQFTLIPGTPFKLAGIVICNASHFKQR